ncbi:MAG: NfeD family protein [Phycisphaeraceae bacterium]
MNATVGRTAVVRRWLLAVLAGLLLTAGLAGGATPTLVQAQSEEPAVREPAPETDAEDAAEFPEPPESPADSSDDPEPATPPADRAGDTSSRQVTMPSGANVAVIRVEGMIDGFTTVALERLVDRALDQGADIIVFDLHTPGGKVDAGRQISRYIKGLPVYTVAWVNNEAYSAGTLIASAADEIVMSSSSALGDSAPILMGQDMAPTERAKQVSPILEEYRDNAGVNGYDFALFHAMTVLGIEAYLIEHPETGERKVVNGVDYEVMVRGADPQQFEEERDAMPLEERIGKATIDLARDPAHRGQWREVTGPDQWHHNGNTLLTMNQTRAQQVGLAREIVSNEQELARHLGAASVVRVDPTWSEQLAGFLTSPIVRIGLVIALLLGAYIEFQSPGVGVAGGVALLALLGLLGAPFIVGLAEAWHILVFVLGLALLIVELIWLPGFGFLGLAGVAMMFVGLVLSVVPTGGGGGFGPVRLPPQEMWSEVLRSSLYMMVGVFLSFIGFYFITKHFGRLPGLSRLVLADVSPAWNTTDGRALPTPGVSGDEAFGEGRVRPGDTGQVTVGLRPTGRAEINGEVIDVVSFGRWIETGATVRVVEVHGNRIVVDSADT